MKDDHVPGIPTRRHLLAGMATAVAGTAGCISLASSDTGSSDRTPQTTYPERAIELDFGTEFSENGIRAKPLAASVQRSVHLRNGSAVHATEGRQFLFVDVATGNSPGIDPPVAGDFALDVADEFHRGWTTPPDADVLADPDEFDGHYSNTAETGGEETKVYGGVDQRGWVGFEVPAPLDAVPNLVLQPTEAGRPFAFWRLPDAAGNRLLAPTAALSVPDVAVPESVDPGGDVVVTVTAENAGEGAGRLRVALVAGEAAADTTGAGGGPAVTTDGVTVPAGETRTWEGSVPAPETGDAVQVAVRTPSREVTRDVAIG